MAFDRSNTADLTALKNEVLNDPALIGYDVNGNTDALVALLNADTATTGNAPVTADKMLSAIFDVPISSQDQFKIQLLFEGTSGLESDLSNYKARVGALSTPLLDALATITRPLSRAEILFAADDANGIKEFVNISREDWIAARDS